MSKYKQAIVKWNSGTGALLCNNCRIIIQYGFDHKDIVHLCEGCKRSSDHKTQKEK